MTDEAERRVDLKVGISYDSDIRSARKAVQEIAKKNPYVLPEREITVNVDELADSSVVLVVKFWAKKENYWQARYTMLEDTSTASMKRASAFRIRRWMYIWSPGLDLQENPCIIIPYLHRAEKVGVRALSPAAFFSSLRTGLSVYIACRGKRWIQSSFERAISQMKGDKRKKYDKRTDEVDQGIQARFDPDTDSGISGSGHGMYHPVCSRSAGQ